MNKPKIAKLKYNILHKILVIANKNEIFCWTMPKPEIRTVIFTWIKFSLNFETNESIKFSTVRTVAILKNNTVYKYLQIFNYNPIFLMLIKLVQQNLYKKLYRLTVR